MALSSRQLAQLQQAIDAMHGMPATCRRCGTGDWAQWILREGSAFVLNDPAPQQRTATPQALATILASCQRCGLLVTFDRGQLETLPLSPPT